MAADNINWRNWKDFLSITATKSFKFLRNLTFQFDIFAPNFMRAKHLLTDEEFVTFCLLKKTCTPQDVREATPELLESDTFRSSLAQLQNVTAVVESNREDYLRIHIFARYFPNDYVICQEFFAGGEGIR